MLVTLRSGDVRRHVIAPGVSIDDIGREILVPGTISLPPTPSEAPVADQSIVWIAASFLYDASPPATRRTLLAELVRVLAPAEILVVVDHNRPRSQLAAAVAVVRSPRPRGATPAARWARLAYPAAREVHAAGLVVERIRLAADERVQVITARRVASTRPGE